MVADLLSALPRFADSILVTLELTAGGAALALVVAFAFGLLARSPRRGVRFVSRTFVELFRGTSLYVQLFWLFFVLPQLGWRLEPLACGIVALGLNYGAYGSEVVRGGINAVPLPQWEATVALNMSRWQRMRLVVLPQAWPNMIPPFGNLLVQLLKGSALASLITITDLTFQAEQLRSRTGDTALSFGIVLVVYFAIAYLLTLLMNLLELRAKARVGQAPALREALRLRRPPADAAATRTGAAA